jgi:hypothetical protein
VDDDPHFIPATERAEGEPGEHGCLRAEAEEREAAESAPEILELYHAILNPPPDQPYPSQALLDMMRRGEYPHALRAASLRAHFDQMLRRGKWACFGFSEEQGRRVPIRSPWREELAYDDQGGMTDCNRRTHVEVLFYRVGTKKPASPARAAQREKPDRPRVRRVTFKEALRTALNDKKTKAELDRLPDDTARSEFLSAKVGSGISMARKVLQGKI